MNVRPGALLEGRGAGVLLSGAAGPLAILRDKAVASLTLSARLAFVASAYRTGIGTRESLLRPYAGGGATHRCAPEGYRVSWGKNLLGVGVWCRGELLTRPFSCLLLTMRGPRSFSECDRGALGSQ